MTFSFHFHTKNTKLFLQFIIFFKRYIDLLLLEFVINFAISMCTVTYYPKKEGYILTHNRDEKIWRPLAQPPQMYDSQFIYPIDPQGNGTWILDYPYGTLSLLNGGFVKHKPNPPYKKSRGLILKEFTSQNIFNFHQFISHYDLEGIEPFTIISAIHSHEIELNVYVWDGFELHFLPKNPYQPLIWSAVTVYPLEIIKEREIWWSEWVEEHPEATPEEIFSFHLHGGKGNPRSNLTMIVPGEGQTVSISQSIRYSNQRIFQYKDLLKSDQQKIII